MKTLLIVVSVVFAPPQNKSTPVPIIQTFDMWTEKACHDTAAQWHKASGQIIGAPGFRRLQSAWCENPNGEWPMEKENPSFPAPPATR